MQSEAVSQWLDAAHVRSLAECLLVPSPHGAEFTNEKMFGAAFVGFTEPAESVAPAPTMARQSLSEAQSRAASSGMLREKVEPAPLDQHPQPMQPEQIVPPGWPKPVEVIEEIEAPPVIEEPAEPVQSISVEPTLVRKDRVAQRAPEPTPEVRQAVIESPFKIVSAPNSPVPAAEPVRQAFRPLPLSTRLQAFGTWLTEQIPTRSYFICDRHGEIVVDEVGSEKLVKVARTLAHASSSAGRQVGEDQNLGSLHVKIGPDRVMEVVPRQSHFGLVVLGIIVQRPLSRDAVASISRALGTALAEPSAPREG